MQQKIRKLIIETLVDLNEVLKKDELNNPTKETKLYGGKAPLDSLGLVSFITDLEGAISDELGKDIVLADERAMSQKTSPFRSVASLTNYIVNLIE